MKGEATNEIAERLDKWLWAARFFKTRSQASSAIEGGHVKLNMQAVKPSRLVNPGDELEIRTSEQKWTVIVRGLHLQRRPAVEARQLYEETAESRNRREAALETRRLAPEPGSSIKGRPTKQARRKLSRLI